jgi:hypothetical protein
MKDCLVKQIETLVDREVDERLDRKIAHFIVYISKRYGIDSRSMLNAVRDWKESPHEETSDSEIVVMCRGRNSKGKRCKNMGKHDGFCWRHKEQKATIVGAEQQNESAVTNQVHNHDTSIISFSDDCPVCKKGVSSMDSVEMDINI